MAYCIIPFDGVLEILGVHDLDYGSWSFKMYNETKFSHLRLNAYCPMERKTFLAAGIDEYAKAVEFYHNLGKHIGKNFVVTRWMRSRANKLIIKYLSETGSNSFFNCLSYQPDLVSKKIWVGEIDHECFLKNPTFDEITQYVFLPVAPPIVGFNIIEFRHTMDSDIKIVFSLTFNSQIDSHVLKCVGQSSEFDFPSDLLKNSSNSFYGSTLYPLENRLFISNIYDKKQISDDTNNCVFILSDFCCFMMIFNIEKFSTSAEFYLEKGIRIDSKSDENLFPNSNFATIRKI